MSSISDVIATLQTIIHRLGIKKGDNGMDI
jgi:hypothetical protein